MIKTFFNHNFSLMDVVRFVLKNLDQFRLRFWGTFVVGTLEGVAEFFVPVLLSEFTKTDLTPGRLREVIIWVGILLVVSLMLQWYIRRYGESLGLQFANHIRIKYFRSLEKLPVEKLIKHHSGYVLALINKVGDGLTPLFFDVGWNISRGGTHTILFFIFNARESLLLAFVNLGLLLLFVILSVFLSQRIVGYASRLNASRASLLEQYTDFMANILTVKKLGLAFFAGKKLSDKTDDTYQRIDEIQVFHANRWFLLHAVFNVAFLSTIGFILWQVSQGFVSVSVLILFVVAYQMVRKNVERLSEDFRIILELRAYVQGLEEIVELREEKPAAPQPSLSWKSLRFDDVFFQYPGVSKRISIPSFSLKRGEKICVVGTSGEGKTTFLNLLSNFYQPKSGLRFVDKQSYENRAASFFRDSMVIISQEVELFNMTLRENIALGMEISDEKILAFLEELDLVSWVKNLKDGLSTHIGEKGIKLSAGQKQRINLLRGVLLNRDMYLLDEPTSHLDAQSEKKVIEFLKKYLRKKTVVIVSHRESVRSLCDRCYQIKDHTLSAL